MSVTGFSINHHVTVYVLIFILVVGGLLAYRDLPREAAPDIAIPVVMVSTPYFGVSPADIETLVTQTLEKEFKNLRSLKVMTSTSAESVSLITLEFEPDVDIEDALQRIRVQIDKARPDLPSDAEEPEVMEINASDWPILVANVSGDMDPVRLKDLAENMRDDIESVPGVLRVSIAGGVEREIQVLVDPDLLRHHDVSMNDVIGAIRTENINLPGGSLDIGSMKYIVRVAGEFRDLESMRHIIVKSKEGQPVYLRHVAEIKDGFKEPISSSRLTTWALNEDGQRVMITRPNISLSVVKRAGENIISIADETREIIAYYDRMAGDEVHITILNDMSEIIRETVHELESQIISGMLLVLLVLFFFMGGARNALFVAVSVPLSMLITFLVLSFMGVTLNMVVLFALLLALGMLVDNAIVVVENIYRHAGEGKDRMTAALDGTKEVGWAIIASTATTVAAFLPMLFWPGVIGKFMGFLPMTVIITLISSLFVALVINPTLCSRFLKVNKGTTLSEDSVPDNILYTMYRGTLVWALKHRGFVGMVTIMAFVGTFVVFGKTNQGVEFFPQTTPEQFSVELQLPDGTNLETTKDVLEGMQDPIYGAPELVTAWITDAGVKGGGLMGGGAEATHYGQITVELVDHGEQKTDPLAFMDKLREIFSRIPGATVILDRQEMAPPSGAPISIEVAGDDLDELSRIAREIREKIRPIPGIIDLQDNLELSRPEIHVEVDRQRAVMAGLSTESVAQTVRTAINGTKAGNYREGEDEYDITVRVPDERRMGIVDISRLTVVNGDGFHIPLTEVATVEVRGGSGSIRRKDQERVVTISGDASGGYLAANLLREVQKLLEDYPIPAGYELRYTGETEDQKEAGDFLKMALLAAIFLILLILVTEFNSIVQPFIIMCSVLLSLIGVLWSLIITGMPFGIIMTGIGVISLSGVVVNNAIVLIDYINQLRARGHDRRDAVILAGLVRFRPVMLTAITTILGLLPLVLGVSIDFVNRRIATGGASVEMWSPMAKVVTGGLLVATLLTLVIVPVLYSLFDDLSLMVQKAVTRTMGVASIVVFVVGFSIILPISAQAQEIPEEEPPAELIGEDPEQPPHKPALPVPRPDQTYTPLASEDL
ncbi:MAG: efflux RND transporter permease subunit, partial [Bradymonadaceae bacterium]